jgi:hypothetical protein
MLHPALARALAAAHIEDLQPNRRLSSSPVAMPIRRRRPPIGALKPRENQAGVRGK